MTNRVDELETKVAELQATVDGLTEELVETKERVRLLEESVEVDLTTGTRTVGYEPDSGADAAESGEAAEPEPAPEPGGGADPLTESDAQAASRSRTSETTRDDANFIDADSAGRIPSEATAADADGTKNDRTEGDDEAATEDDDIIVA